jgi:hypothetical protein
MMTGLIPQLIASAQLVFYQKDLKIVDISSQPVY